MSEEKYLRDIEGIEETPDVDPTIDWESKRGNLSMLAIDYDLPTLVERIRDWSIDLSPRYQRRSRWDDAKQSKLIESFLLNIPILPIFLNQESDNKFSIVDGRQRLNAISEFIQGNLQLKGLTIFKDLNGMKFDQLPFPQKILLREEITVRIAFLLQSSDKNLKYVVFQRLNTGGTHLNPQEIRHTAFPGPLNDLLLELSVESKFHLLLGIKNKEKSIIYKEMLDAELVLRYLTFRDRWQNFAGGLEHQLDAYMDQNAKMASDQLAEARNDFLSTLNIVEACFGNYAFRRWLPERGIWRQHVVASLYEAEMFACRGLTLESVQQKQDEIIANLKDLFQDKDFKQAVDDSVPTPDYFRMRIEKMQDMLLRVIKGG